MCRAASRRAAPCCAQSKTHHTKCAHKCTCTLAHKNMHRTLTRIRSRYSRCGWTSQVLPNQPVAESRVMLPRIKMKSPSVATQLSTHMHTCTRARTHARMRMWVGGRGAHRRTGGDVRVRSRMHISRIVRGALSWQVWVEVRARRQRARRCGMCRARSAQCGQGSALRIVLERSVPFFFRLATPAMHALARTQACISRTVTQSVFRTLIGTTQTHACMHARVHACNRAHAWVHIHVCAHARKCTHGCVWMGTRLCLAVWGRAAGDTTGIAVGR